ncbi:protein DpdD [Streptomyces sp. NPDC096152]|uniref:protein DpdD n=1 Tax=Streptomyces sp. NPDC096152 TaxID=3366078 RepID=UPI00382D38B5
MTAERPAAPAPSAQDLEAFLQRFFSQGNDAWPDMDPDPGKGDRARPFVDLLRSGSDIPIVLPRYQQAQDRFAIYVIARDDAHATLVGNIITAFAGATYLSGAGVHPCTLDSDDPIEAAVQEFAGTATTTFRLETHPNRRFRQRLTDVALLMQHTLAHRPPRLWRAVKPTGRLLAEFDAALAAGGQAASQAVLDQLVGQGGITAANLAHLHIKRLTRLGLDRELLDYPGLGDVLRQDPPAPVKAAVLDAVFSCDVQEPLSRGDLPHAQQALHDRGFLALAPFEDDMESYSADALVVLLLAAVTRGALHSSQRILTAIEHTASRDVLPPVLREAATTLLSPQNASQNKPAHEVAGTPVASPKPSTPPSRMQDTDGAAVEPIPASWADLISAIADGYTGMNAILEHEVWTAWPSPAADDRAVAALLEELHDEGQRKVWRCVGAFIESVGYDQPAPLSARALITCALAYDWLGPGDLLAVQALTEIVLRSSPSAVVYGQLLGELADTCERWVAPERASIALDFADRLVLEACPDPDARESLALALLLPLSVHQGRLDLADIAMARRLSLELGIELDWHEQPDDDLVQDTDARLQKAAGRNVLLYSLDQRVLDRVSEALQQLAPGVKVASAHDSVGSPPLRQKARQADVVVLATRCAKHAATGFITQHAKAAVIDYADGSGSASLMRAAVHGLLRTVHGD